MMIRHPMTLRHPVSENAGYVLSYLNMGWLRFVGSKNDRSLLQKCPLKETIFCKTDVLQDL